MARGRRAEPALFLLAPGQPRPHPPTVYLLAYNLASAVGWAYILFIVATALQAGDDAATLYDKVELALKVVQSAAALEVLHAVVGLVRSPVATTALQVASRLTLVWVFTVPYAACHAHWSLYLMVGRCVRSGWRAAARVGCRCRSRGGEGGGSA
jgi:hypothetical protein